MNTQKVKIPPYCDYTVRNTDSFYVYSGDKILGPDSADQRVLRIRTSHEPMEIEISHQNGKLSLDEKLRPSHKEPNDGVSVAVDIDVTETSIRDMMRLYIAEAMELKNADSIETPDEFFDFDIEDEQDLLVSPYEIQDMIEEQVQTQTNTPAQQSETEAGQQQTTTAEQSFESQGDSPNAPPPALGKKETTAETAA